MPNHCPTCGGDFAENLKQCPVDGTLLLKEPPLLPRTPLPPPYDIPAPAYGGPPIRRDGDQTASPPPMKFDAPFPTPAYGGPVRRATAIRRNRPIFTGVGLLAGCFAGTLLGQMYVQSLWGISLSAFVFATICGALGWFAAGIPSRA